jgi:hypothetical protein
MKLNAILSGVFLATAFTAASALTVATGNNPQPGQSNLVFNPCDLASDTGTTVQGCLNDDHSTLIDLTSDEVLFINGGQATLRADDDEPFSRLTIATGDMTALILNIDATEDGFVTFTDGAGTSSPFALDENGQNFFTLTGIVGNSVSFMTSLTSGGAETDIVDEVRQIRVTGGQVTVIPEPETYALMMAGLAAVGFISRRRRTKK